MPKRRCSGSFSIKRVLGLYKKGRNVVLSVRIKRILCLR